MIGSRRFNQLRLSRVTRLCLSHSLNTWQLWCTVLLFPDWNKTNKRFAFFLLLRCEQRSFVKSNVHLFADIYISVLFNDTDEWTLWLKAGALNSPVLVKHEYLRTFAIRLLGTAWKRFSGSINCSQPFTYSKFTLCNTKKRSSWAHELSTSAVQSFLGNFCSRKREKTAWLVVSNQLDLIPCLLYLK